MSDMEDIDKVINKKKESNLYLERKKISMKKAIESGMLNGEQQYGMIESVIEDLLGHNLISEDAAGKFYTRQEEYIKRLDELQNDISGFYKKTFESILEL